MEPAPDPVRAYHNGTKHHFDRFARSLGYLDWASQPRPFRHFHGAARQPLYPAPGADALASPPVLSYPELLAAAESPSRSPLPLGLASLGFFLRHALGLSAWKVFQGQRWSLRVNPSSGNLHPTEAYLVTADRVWHYAADAHELEERCRLSLPAGPAVARDTCLVILTSIHWREAWKYGERAFRYCQHDLGHAIAALRVSAALCGWEATLVDSLPSAALACLSGVDRDADFIDAEREEPGCALLVRAPVDAAAATRRDPDADVPDLTPLLDAAREGVWTGRASQLSVDHVQWTFIDDIAAATRGHFETSTAVQTRLPADAGSPSALTMPASGRVGEVPMPPAPEVTAVILQRRSAVAFDGTSTLDRARFTAILDQLMPVNAVPWDALWWPPRIHLLLFVHRVTGLEPGLYLLPRTTHGAARLRRAITRDFTWTAADPRLPMIRLAAGDCRRLAGRLSCDQAIAADGAFSVGMLADFADALHVHGAPFYRRLFWEAGVVGQQLYLAAEAAGVRGTGIGCYFDDAVHDVLGLEDDAIQSLYHFAVGSPVEDRRLTTEPGYVWEQGR